MSSSPHSRSHSKRSRSSEKCGIPASEFKEILDAFIWEPASLEIILEVLCERYPNKDPTVVRSKLERIFSKHVGSTSTSSGHSTKLKRKKTGQLLKAEVDDALKIYDGNQMDALIEYLSFISEHEHLTKEEIEDELRTVYGVTRPTASRRDSSKARGKRTKSTDKGRRSKKSSISENDVSEALEYYGYDFGPHLAENLVNYFHSKYPHLSRDDIRKQLRPYDLMGSDVTKPSSPLRTPPTPARRGEFYQPSDFSPSLLGACSQEQIEWLKKKRAKHLPDYVSPLPLPSPRRTSSSFSPRRRRLSFTSPERDHHSSSSSKRFK